VIRAAFKLVGHCFVAKFAWSGGIRLSSRQWRRGADALVAKTRLEKAAWLEVGCASLNMSTRLLFCLILAVPAFASPLEEVCARLLVFQDGARRVELNPTAASSLKELLLKRTSSVSAAAQAIGLSHRLLHKALRGEGTLSEEHYQLLLGLLTGEQRAPFVAVETPAIRERSVLLRQGISRSINAGQSRLLLSYRRNFLGGVAELAERLGISGSFWYKISAGNARSIETELLSKMLALFHLETALWDRLTEFKVQGDCCDAANLEADLFMLASFSVVNPSNPYSQLAITQFGNLARAWHLRRHQVEKPNAAQLEAADRFAQAVVSQLPELDLRRPVLEMFESTALLQVDPSLAAQPKVRVVPGRQDWDAVYASLPLESLDSLAAEIGDVVPSRAFRTLWQNEMALKKLPTDALNRLLGIGSKRQQSLREGVPFTLSATELVRLIALLGLPIRSTVRLATEYESGGEEDRLILTPLFRKAVQAHVEHLGLAGHEVSSGISSYQSYLSRLVSGSVQKIRRRNLKRLVSKLQINPLAARALLGPPLICEPSLEPERCVATAVDVGGQVIPFVEYKDPHHAVQDLVLLSAKLALPQQAAARLGLEKAYEMRWLPLVWRGIYSALGYPKEERTPLAYEALMGSLRIGKQGTLVFEGDLGQALRDIRLGAIQEANEPSAAVLLRRKR
jgi:hypothetical protein